MLLVFVLDGEPMTKPGIQPSAAGCCSLASRCTRNLLCMLATIICTTSPFCTLISSSVMAVYELMHLTKHGRLPLAAEVDAVVAPLFLRESDEDDVGVELVLLMLLLLAQLSVSCCARSLLNSSFGPPATAAPFDELIEPDDDGLARLGDIVLPLLPLAPPADAVDDRFDDDEWFVLECSGDCGDCCCIKW